MEGIHARVRKAERQGSMSGTEIILDFFVLSGICFFLWRIFK
jgi:hypothetical protein